MNTVSIGYVGDDGDFRILATLNNIDQELPEKLFNDAVGAVRDLLQSRLGESNNPIALEVLERQDAPDHVVIDPELNT